ncbi:unnamed protein product [Schistocephalus solidus]|uniref:Uncharacterized protein n=1 Tax=Schistocephalus solidus TaxID=70667 RepID=A0A3P7D4T9_SCHSO|nr:unnamed protein product [Schistocephalus solidus]
MSCSNRPVGRTVAFTRPRDLCPESQPFSAGANQPIKYRLNAHWLTQSTGTRIDARAHVSLSFCLPPSGSRSLSLSHCRHQRLEIRSSRCVTAVAATTAIVTGTGPASRLSHQRGDTGRPRTREIYVLMRTSTAPAKSASVAGAAPSNSHLSGRMEESTEKGDTAAGFRRLSAYSSNDREREARVRRVTTTSSLGLTGGGASPAVPPRKSSHLTSLIPALSTGLPSNKPTFVSQPSALLASLLTSLLANPVLMSPDLLHKFGLPQITNISHRFNT